MVLAAGIAVATPGATGAAAATGAAGAAAFAGSAFFSSLPLPNPNMNRLPNTPVFCALAVLLDAVTLREQFFQRSEG